MRKVRWGIIGCGAVTEVKSGPAFRKAAGSELVAVMRRDAERARDYAERHGVPRWYSDAARLVEDPEVDAVYVATPPASHREYTLLAARAGKPVYVEKPMARDFAECEEMISACAAAGVPLFVAYYRRALPRFLEVKRLLDSGAIGDPRYVTITLSQDPPLPEGQPLPWRVLPEIAGAGLFLDLASHVLDFLDYALGPIERVSGFAANQAGRYPAEDTVGASFVFASGVHGVGIWSFTSFEEPDRVEIAGTRGRIRFSSFANEPIELRGPEGSRSIAIEHPEHVQQPLIQTVVDALNGVGVCPSTGETAARTTRVMDRVLEQHRRASASAASRSR